MESASLSALSATEAILFHGTSIRSRLALLNGAPLDLSAATAQKLDGPQGFFLATHAEDAAYFAARRGEGTILRFTILPRALQRLFTQGAAFWPIPVGNVAYFNGSEFFIPPVAFTEFNQQLALGEIDVQPYAL